MINMVKDKNISGIGWIDAHDISEVAVGRALTIQNKGTYPLLIFISSVAPANNDNSGYRLLVNEVFDTEVGDVVWLKAEGGLGTACIQEGV